MRNLIGNLFVLTQAVSPAFAGGENFTSTHKVFGVRLRTEATEESRHLSIQKWLRDEAARLQVALDPDCRWRKPTSGGCENTEAKLTETIEELAREFETETQGYFNTSDVSDSGEKCRDFDGLSQGFLIDEMKKQVPEHWLIDFAGDIYFSGGFEPSLPLTVSNPFFEWAKDAKPIATVKMKRGFMIASTGKHLGAKVRGKLGDGGKFSDDIHRIVLFAHPDFSGARLDAWATAIIAGGKSLIRHLESLRSYQGKWAYLYVENKPNPLPPTCSENLKCQFTENNGQVETPW